MIQTTTSKWGANYTATITIILFQVSAVLVLIKLGHGNVLTPYEFEERKNHRRDCRHDTMRAPFSHILLNIFISFVFFSFGAQCSKLRSWLGPVSFVSSLKPAPRAFSGCAVVNDKIYLFGGYNSAGVLPNVSHSWANS